MRCTYCGSQKHTLENCPKTWTGQMNRKHMRCSYCGSTSHNINACPKTYIGSVARTFYSHSVEDDYFVDK